MEMWPRAKALLGILFKKSKPSLFLNSPKTSSGIGIAVGLIDLVVYLVSSLRFAV